MRQGWSCVFLLFISQVRALKERVVFTPLMWSLQGVGGTVPGRIFLLIHTKLSAFALNSLKQSFFH